MSQTVGVDVIETRESTAREGRRGSGAPWRPAAQFTALLVMACLVAGCGLAAEPIVPDGGPGTLTYSSVGEQVWAQQVLDLTNAERAAHGLAPLILDEAASKAAYEHCWDMDLRNYFDHQSPDGEGPADRLAKQSVEYRDAGENIARGHGSPYEVVQAWMASPSHRVNMLYPGWTHIGIGVHSGPSRGPWWTQEFFR